MQNCHNCSLSNKEVRAVLQTPFKIHIVSH